MTLMKAYRSTFLSAATVATFVSSFQTIAQTVETSEKLETVEVTGRAQAAYKPDTAMTGTKTVAPLRDVPQTINVVPAQVIADQHATSMQDVLKNVPGLTFGNGDGQRDQVFIRGFSAISDQFVDGVRDDALYFRDLSNVEQIEVIKGPAAVLYGRGSSGGLINRVTKRPGRDLANVSLSYGPYGDLRGEFDVGRVTNEAVSWRLTGAVEDGDTYRSQGFIKRRTIAPSVRLNFDPDTSLLLQADYLRDKRINDFGVPSYQGRVVDVPRSAYYGAANARDSDYVESKVGSATATFRHRFNESLTLRNVTRYYDYQLDRNNTNVAAENEATQRATLRHANLIRNEHGVFNRTELTQSFNLGPTRHEVLYGAELGTQRKDLDNWTAAAGTVDLFNPVLPFVVPKIAGLPATRNQSTFETRGVYIQDLATLTPQWKALVGVRYDSFKQSSDYTQPTTASVSRTDSPFSPRVGVTWQPTEEQAYYVSWTRSFQPSGEAFALALNNAALAPERTTNYEVGTKLDLLDHTASFTAAVFQLQRTNIKASDPVTLQLIPIGTQRTQGVEMTLNVDLSNGWRAVAGYSYLDGEITKSIAVDQGQLVQGKHSTLTPRHMANLWVTREFGGGFGAGAGGNYVGDRFANPGNTVTLGTYATADAAAWYRIDKHALLRLNVYNVFDKAYTVSGHGTSPFLNTPGAPRATILTANYSF